MLLPPTVLARLILLLLSVLITLLSLLFHIVCHEVLLLKSVGCSALSVGLLNL
jgi:hypothetical protein